jgi:ParB family chromosome partitioning protein
VLLDLLAVLAALSVNAVQGAQDRPDCDRLAHADQLATSLQLDMRPWWSPSVDGFYGRLSKASLIHAVQESGCQTGVVISALKKPEAARFVAGLLDGSGWLPLPLRAPAAPATEQAEAA